MIVAWGYSVFYNSKKYSSWSVIFWVLKKDSAKTVWILYISTKPFWPHFNPNNAVELSIPSRFTSTISPIHQFRIKIIIYLEGIPVNYKVCLKLNASSTNSLIYAIHHTRNTIIWKIWTPKYHWFQRDSIKRQIWDWRIYSVNSIVFSRKLRLLG